MHVKFKEPDRETLCVDDTASDRRSEVQPWVCGVQSSLQALLELQTLVYGVQS